MSDKPSAESVLLIIGEVWHLRNSCIHSFYMVKNARVVFLFMFFFLLILQLLLNSLLEYLLKHAQQPHYELLLSCDQ